MVLIRNLLFAPARGHFNQPIAPIVSALVLPRFASFSNSSTAFLSSSGSSSIANCCPARHADAGTIPALNPAPQGGASRRRQQRGSGGEEVGGGGAGRAPGRPCSPPRRGLRSGGRRGPPGPGMWCVPPRPRCHRLSSPRARPRAPGLPPEWRSAASLALPRGRRGAGPGGGEASRRVPPGVRPPPGGAGCRRESDTRVKNGSHLFRGCFPLGFAGADHPMRRRRTPRRS